LHIRVRTKLSDFILVGFREERSAPTQPERSIGYLRILCLAPNLGPSNRRVASPLGRTRDLLVPSSQSTVVVGPTPAPLRPSRPRDFLCRSPRRRPPSPHDSAPSRPRRLRVCCLGAVWFPFLFQLPAASAWSALVQLGHVTACQRPRLPDLCHRRRTRWPSPLPLILFRPPPNLLPPAL